MIHRVSCLLRKQTDRNEAEQNNELAITKLLEANELDPLDGDFVHTYGDVPPSLQVKGFVHQLTSAWFLREPSEDGPPAA